MAPELSAHFMARPAIRIRKFKSDAMMAVTVGRDESSR